MEDEIKYGDRSKRIGILLKENDYGSYDISIYNAGEVDCFEKIPSSKQAIILNILGSAYCFLSRKIKSKPNADTEGKPQSLS